MKKPMSLRLRLTLLCTALLTLCCLLLTLTNNLSAVQMAHSVQAVPLLPAQTAEADAHTDFPMASLEINETVQQARGIFHLQSLLAMAAVLAAGLYLIYRLVGKALAPLDELAGQIRGRTAEDLERPLAIPDSGDEVAELARAFNQMSRRLNQVFVMQKNFSHNAAHEFRTPLTILKTRIGLFRKKRDFSPAAVQDFLQIMEGGGGSPLCYGEQPAGADQSGADGAGRASLCGAADSTGRGRDRASGGRAADLRSGGGIPLYPDGK